MILGFVVVKGLFFVVVALVTVIGVGFVGAFPVGRITGFACDGGRQPCLEVGQADLRRSEASVPLVEEILQFFFELGEVQTGAEELSMQRSHDSSRLLRQDVVVDPVERGGCGVDHERSDAFQQVPRIGVIGVVGEDTGEFIAGFMERAGVDVKAGKVNGEDVEGVGVGWWLESSCSVAKVIEQVAGFVEAAAQPQCLGPNESCQPCGSRVGGDRAEGEDLVRLIAVQQKHGAHQHCFVTAVGIVQKFFCSRGCASGQQVEAAEEAQRVRREGKVDFDTR